MAQWRGPDKRAEPCLRDAVRQGSGLPAGKGRLSLIFCFFCITGKRKRKNKDKEEKKGKKEKKEKKKKKIKKEKEN